MSDTDAAGPLAGATLYTPKGCPKGSRIRRYSGSRLLTSTSAFFKKGGAGEENRPAPQSNPALARTGPPKSTRSFCNAKGPRPVAEGGNFSGSSGTTTTRRGDTPLYIMCKNAVFTNEF